MSGGQLFTLLDRAQNGDDEACEQVLLENSGLIWSIVRRYYGCGVETDDLYQLGCIGFIKAVKGFDLTYGTQFSTYAVPKIAGEIRRFLRDNGAIKVGRSIREKGQALAAARERLRHRLGRDPRLSELAEETGLTPGTFLPLGSIASSPGILAERIHLFFARDLVQGEARPDDGEFVETLWVPYQDLLDMARRGEIQDGKTLAGILKASFLLEAPQT